MESFQSSLDPLFSMGSVENSLTASLIRSAVLNSDAVD